MPLLIICDMMGVPESRRDEVFAHSNVILAGDDPEYVTSDNPLGDYLAAGAGLSGLMTELAAAREAAPTDDITSALVHGTVDGERLTHQEIASFFILLCVAGNETTRNAITHGVWGMHLDPSQWEAWSARRRRGHAHRGRRDRPLGLADQLDAAHGGVRHDDRRRPRVGGREAAARLRRGEPGRRPSSPIPIAWTCAAPPTRTRASAPTARTSASARTSPAARSRVLFRELFAGMPDLRVVGEPDRLRSIFVNGIKHLPVALAGTDAAR